VLIVAASLYRSGLVRGLTGRYLQHRIDVARALDRHGPGARARLAPYFAKAGIPFPPEAVSLLVFKRERSMELWAESAGRRAMVRRYPVLAVSGIAGPKLREGDGMTPEGIYRVTALNPRSKYHLSLLLDYPNGFDRAMAFREGRTDPGGDIYIHGSDVSVGCVAVGDRAAEELFVLAALTGMERVTVIIAPLDLRSHPAPAVTGHPWVRDLYGSLKRELGGYR
jgi:hypothetical protein